LSSFPWCERFVRSSTSHERDDGISFFPPFVAPLLDSPLRLYDSSLFLAPNSINGSMRAPPPQSRFRFSFCLFHDSCPPNAFGQVRGWPRFDYFLAACDLEYSLPFIPFFPFFFVFPTDEVGRAPNFLSSPLHRATRGRRIPTFLTFYFYCTLKIQNLSSIFVPLLCASIQQIFAGFPLH